MSDLFTSKNKVRVKMQHDGWNRKAEKSVLNITHVHFCDF